MVANVNLQKIILGGWKKIWRKRCDCQVELVEKMLRLQGIIQEEKKFYKEIMAHIDSLDVEQSSNDDDYSF